MDGFVIGVIVGVLFMIWIDKVLITGLRNFLRKFI